MKTKKNRTTDKIQIEKKTVLLFEQILQVLKPRPIMSISKWAEEFRFLSSEASAEPGKYRLDRAVYQKGMMDAVSDPNVSNIIFMTSAQVGKTEILLNIIGYYIDYEPSPILLALPTKELADPFSKDRLAPMLRDTPVLANKVKDVKSRNSNNTILHKSFPGGQINIIGANSPSSLASRPIKIVLCDELDRFPVSAGTEGDPFELVKKRTNTFKNRKIIAVSTPTVKGVSRIEKEYENSTMEQFCIPCPRCEYKQPLEWPSIVFPKNGEDAGMRCNCCDEVIPEQRWKENFQQGEWIRRKESRNRGFHLNELYSPWKAWNEIIAEFRDAKNKGQDVLKVWVNTALGESWEERGESASEKTLLERREVYGAQVPKGVLILTAGIDVQVNRFEVEVVGWGRERESWGISYKKIIGDMEKPETWNQLEEFLKSTFKFADGTEIGIAAACIDTGYKALEVYQFVKRAKVERLIAIKGKGGSYSFVSTISRNNKEKIPLVTLGVDAGKETIMMRLKMEEEGAGYCHFPKEIDAGYDELYFKGLTGEHKVIKKINGVPTYKWVVKNGHRNEPLDIRNYATAALELLMPINFDSLENKLAKGINYLDNKKRRKTKTQRGVVSKGITM